MQTALADFIKNSPDGPIADKILRSCVHCGFCTATCPTYQLLGDELDGPRGRIYQIKQLFEGAAPTHSMQVHLDRCLTCRSCETTCPSGVTYHTLLDLGREHLEKLQPRPISQRIFRATLRTVFATPKRFGPLLAMARLARPMLPRKLRNKVLPTPRRIAEPTQQTERTMLVLDGCVQPALAPQINQSMRRILAHLKINLVTVNPGSCCGALPHHLSDSEKAREMAKANIDAWMPWVEKGAEAIVVTASGCGAQVKDYPSLLAHDATYLEKAKKITALAKDPVEILAAEDLSHLPLTPSSELTAVHTPCTLQHALKLDGLIETVMQQLGYNLTTVAEGHLCCGSAGTYALTQPELSQQLRTKKLAALSVNKPARIVTANIGCLSHLQDGEAPPVIHWVDLLEQDLA